MEHEKSGKSLPSDIQQPTSIGYLIPRTTDIDIDEWGFMNSMEFKSSPLPPEYPVTPGGEDAQATSQWPEIYDGSDPSFLSDQFFATLPLSHMEEIPLSFSPFPLLSDPFSFLDDIALMPPLQPCGAPLPTPEETQSQVGGGEIVSLSSGTLAHSSSSVAQTSYFQTGDQASGTDKIESTQDQHHVSDTPPDTLPLTTDHILLTQPYIFDSITMHDSENDMTDHGHNQHKPQAPSSALPRAGTPQALQPASNTETPSLSTSSSSSSSSSSSPSPSGNSLPALPASALPPVDAYRLHTSRAKPSRKTRRVYNRRLTQFAHLDAIYVVDLTLPPSKEASNHEDGIDDTTYSDDITNGSESHAEPTSVDIMDINSNSECSTRKPNTTITNNKNNHDNNDNSSSSNSIDDNEGDNDSDMGPIRNKTIAATIDSSITCDKDLQSRALLIHLTVYDSNGEELKSFFRCSNCPDKHFKVRQTARRHVRSHYSASKEMIECLGCGMRFARLDSCKRHIATPRNIQCHANQATGYYSIHDRIKGTCLRFKYPITSFFTANNRKDDLPADHAEQLAIVEQRNREIAAKYKKRRSGYRPRGITQVVTDVPDDEEVKDEEVETTAE